MLFYLQYDCFSCVLTFSSFCLTDDKDFKELEAKLKQHQRDAARRENTLVHRLTTKEQELQDYLVSLLCKIYLVHTTSYL